MAFQFSNIQNNSAMLDESEQETSGMPKISDDSLSSHAYFVATIDNLEGDSENANIVGTKDTENVSGSASKRLDFSGIAELKKEHEDPDVIKEQIQNPFELNQDSDKKSEERIGKNIRADDEKDTTDVINTDCNNDTDKIKDTKVDSTMEKGSIEDIKDAADPDMNKCASYDNVKIKVIDVPDDEDLFDFLTDKPKLPQESLDEVSNLSESNDKQSEENLQDRELYRYLAASDPTSLRSQEVTPFATPLMTPRESDNDKESSSSCSESSSSDFEGFESVSSDNELEQKPDEEIARLERHDMFLLHDDESVVEEPSKEPRKRPGRKIDPNSKRQMKKRRQKRKAAGQLTERTVERLEKSREVTDKWLKDLEIPENLCFTQDTNFKITDLNEYLTCGLCKGYLYEASTITECMHTFCKTCIVRHCMEVSLQCPVCHILIHPTDPFIHIRLDRMIQDIVYKLLPSVADKEMENIKAFYAEHPGVEPKEIYQPPPKPKIFPKEKTDSVEKIQSSLVSLLLEAEGDGDDSKSLDKKYVRVNGSATVENVCMFLKNKLNLQDQTEVELYCCGDAIEEPDCTLENIKYTFYGEEDSLMLMQYKVRET